MSAAALPPRREDAGTSGDAAIQRRVGWIWALLFLNVLTYGPGNLLVTIPLAAGQAITQGALWLALLLALTVNRRVVLRPNTFLTLCTVLAAISLIVGLAVTLHSHHVDSSYRAVRFIGFVATLWLLTPWFGRRDRTLLRCHLRCLVGVIVLSLAGMVISPAKAFYAGRLSGIVWPIFTTQLAHYAAVTAGLGVVLWLSGVLRRNAALALTVLGLLVLILTHTRTALIGFIVGILVAGASLFLVRRRVRRAFAIGLVVVAVGGVVTAPSVSHWFERGQSGSALTQLSGRTRVWHELVNAPRSKAQVLFGAGLSNTSFHGQSIDNSWLAVYQEQGLVGDVLIGLFLLALLFTAAMRPRGPDRALALFLATYCIVASYAEVGLGDASPYLLDLTVAASLLMDPARRGISVPRMAT